MPGPDGEDITVNVPTLAPGFWVSLLAREPHDELWEQMSANYPAIEFGQPSEPPDPVVPSAFVVRQANLTFDIDQIKGITRSGQACRTWAFPTRAWLKPRVCCAP